MKLLVDFLPLLLFYAAYKLQDIFFATGVLIVASAVQFLYLRMTGGKISPLQIFSLVLIVLLGGGALLFHDVRFLMWKPTLANLVFAIAIAFTLTGKRKPAAAMLYEEALGEEASKVSEAMWRRFSKQWIVFFLLEGVLNLVVAFNMSQSAWVNFKAFGLPLMSVIMGSLQMAQLQPILATSEEPKVEEPTVPV